MAEGQQQQEGQDPHALTCEHFLGVATQTTRPGVPDQKCWWIDGFIPLAPRNLRTLYGIGTFLFTATSGTTIVCFYFYNIGDTPFVVVFLSDGSAIQVNTNSGHTKTILAPGTITAPSITQLGISQYGRQYLLIVAEQPNGYWVWDGSTLFTAGTLSPNVTLTNVGSGYSGLPVVTVSGGHGSGAKFVPTISTAGQVTGVKVTKAGSGYLATDSSPLTLIFTGGNAAGTGAVLTAHMTVVPGGSGAVLQLNWLLLTTGFYQLVSVSVLNPGVGYTTLVSGVLNTVPPTTWGNNAPPSFNFTLGGSGIAIVDIIANPLNPQNVVNIGFVPPIGSLPTLSATDPGFRTVSSVTINNGGSGYGPNAAIAVTGAVPFSQAVLVPIVNSGVIVAVNITNGGQYSSGTPSLAVTDTATSAQGTVTLMPFGVKGNGIETYQGRVWLIDSATLGVSAPGSFTDFSTADGGLQVTSNDPFLRVTYIKLVQTNGFLYLVADSSMNYVSGVQTSASGVTTFTNNNADPEIGSPYPAAIITVGNEVLAANATGIFISKGGVFDKRSDDLDGVYNTVPNFNGQQLSAAKATIFSKRVWMVLVPIIDLFKNVQVNKLLMLRDDGKIWWASEQDVPLTFIAGQEINSVFTAWGTDGQHLFRLFNQPSSNFIKLMQSKFWDVDYRHSKSATNAYAMVQFLGTRNLAYNIDIDSENNSAANAAQGAAAVVSWVNANGQPVTWVNASSATVIWLATSNIEVMVPTSVGQWGVLLGMTFHTTCDDLALISEKIEIGDVQYRGI